MMHYSKITRLKLPLLRKLMLHEIGDPENQLDQVALAELKSEIERIDCAAEDRADAERIDLKFNDAD